MGCLAAGGVYSGAYEIGDGSENKLGTVVGAVPAYARLPIYPQTM